MRRIFPSEPRSPRHPYHPTWLLLSTGLQDFASFLKDDLVFLGQDFAAVGGDEDRVLVLGGPAAIQRDGGPLVVPNAEAGGTEDEDGLDREGLAQLHLARLAVAMGQHGRRGVEGLRGERIGSVGA